MQIEFMWKTDSSAVENCPALYRAPGGYVVQGKVLDAETRAALRSYWDISEERREHEAAQPRRLRSKPPR